MIAYGVSKCPECGGELRYYDTVKRMVKIEGGEKVYFTLRRFRCLNCRKVHRELPDYIVPYKQYAADIINGVIAGSITPDTIGFEDYPCEMTMNRWAFAKITHGIMREDE